MVTAATSTSAGHTNTKENDTITKFASKLAKLKEMDDESKPMPIYLDVQATTPMVNPPKQNYLISV
jgi:hypothetical protein